MFSHVCLGVGDFDRAYAFYSVLADALGLEPRFFERERPWAGWQPAGGGRPLLVIGAPLDGAPATSGNGQMTAFLAAHRATVDRCHALALAHGGRCEGPRGCGRTITPITTAPISATPTATSCAWSAMRPEGGPATPPSDARPGP